MCAVWKKSMPGLEQGEMRAVAKGGAPTVAGSIVEGIVWLPSTHTTGNLA